MPDPVLQDSVLYRGREYGPGEVIPDLDPDTEAGLVERGLLGKGRPKVEEAPAPEPVREPAGEDLSGLNKAQLVAVALERGVDHDSKATKAELLKLLS